MGIDWFTVVVQIINFIILVWLLKKFFYRPVLNAMDKREEKIALRLQEAAEQKSRATAEKERYLEMQQELESSIRAELETARKQADDLRGQLLRDAQQEGESARREWRKVVEKEKTTFLEQTTAAMAHHFERLAAAVLRDLADAELEEKIVQAFLRKINTLPPSDLAGIRAATAAGEQIVITSGFVLAETARAEIYQHWARTFGPENFLAQFLQDKELVAGINLTIGKKRIRWDIKQYLQEFQDDLRKTLDKETLR